LRFEIPDIVVQGVLRVAEQTTVAGRSPARLAVDRFRKDKVAMTGLFIALFIFIVAFLSDPILNFLGRDPYTIDKSAIDLDYFNYPLGPWGGISTEHWLGVEPGVGRDVFARLLTGARISITIAIVTSVLSIGLGLTIGVISGYFKGKVDEGIGRIIDLLLAFPTMFMLIATARPLADRLQKFLGVDDRNIATIMLLIILLTIFGWAGLARLIRADVLSLSEREFVLAAESLGASRSRIIFKEIMPSLWPKAIIFLSLALPGFLTTEAALSFLGIGIQEPMPSWGVMLENAVRYAQTIPIYFIIPATTLVVLVTALNLVGAGVSDAFDPKLERN
jgi:peptide/nickel transport system permease protein